MNIQDKIKIIKKNPKYKDFRQTQMGALIGVSHNTYVNYRKGLTNPNNPAIIERIDKLVEETNSWLKFAGVER
ncbi:hypothetical protein ES708_02997 [subsurface metagenome]|jgi:DNA-binding XRE family transcriptional regulator